MYDLLLPSSLYLSLHLSCYSPHGSLGFSPTCLLYTSNHIPTSGHLHWLFPLPGAHLPQICTWHTSLIPSDVNSNVIFSMRPILSTLFKIVTCCLFYRLTNSVIFLYFYPYNTHQLLTYDRIYLFSCLLCNVYIWLLEYKVHEGRDIFLLLTLLYSK